MADETSGFEVVDCDLEDLCELDTKALGRRWRTLIGGRAPAGLGRALMVRMLSYHIQAQRFGDLDRVSRQALNDIYVRSEVGTKDVSSDAADRERSSALPAPQLRPGTVLTREHGAVLHRVMVMEQGFSWNGETYESLSKVAFAITGTRWNGPRFFGLRDRREATEAAGGKSIGCKPEEGRAVRKGSPAGSAALTSQAASP